MTYCSFTMLSYSAVTALISLFFFFNDTATTEIYTLSLHDALPILVHLVQNPHRHAQAGRGLRTFDELLRDVHRVEDQDRKSTRLNSSHVRISYAVFCLKKKICECLCYPPWSTRQSTSPTFHFP